MLAELLRSKAHAVWAADDGVKGSELILAHRPDVALSTSGCPGWMGWASTSRVRDVTARLVLLVALTGYGLPPRPGGPRNQASIAPF